MKCNILIIYNIILFLTIYNVNFIKINKKIIIQYLYKNKN